MATASTRSPCSAVRSSWWRSAGEPRPTSPKRGGRRRPGRPAVDAERFDAESPWFIETAVHYDEAEVAPRWDATPLCGRTWHEMAAGEGGTMYLWQDASFAPTCRSCLRVVDTWFPRPMHPRVSSCSRW